VVAPSSKTRFVSALAVLRPYPNNPEARKAIDLFGNYTIAS
jgi:hypothetical protein